MSHFKALEKAASAAKEPRSNRFERIRAFLKTIGFKEVSDTTNTEKRRYVKKVSGTDDRNAHRTIATIRIAEFSAPDPDNKLYSEIVKVCKQEGLPVGKPRRQVMPSKKIFVTTWAYKGSFSVAITRKEYVKPIIDLTIISETTKPDLEFERSGQGRGQII